MKQKGKNNIPVYDICSLAATQHLQDDIIAEVLSEYLLRHPDLRFPHRHSFYHLVFFSKGAGTHTIDFEHFPVQSGQIYFMVPGQVHTWDFEGEVDGYIINFSEQFLHSFLKEGQHIEQFPFFSGVAGEGVVQLQQAAQRIVPLLAAIISELALSQPFAMDMVKINLLSLFILVSREVLPAKVQPVVKQKQLVLYNFRKLVEQHYRQKRLPKEYAELLYITPNHLNALCNELLGKPAGEVIRDRVLLEAKRMLVSAGAGITEIAWQLNFADNSYFTKFFKKYTGSTPEEFRSAVVMHPKL